MGTSGGICAISYGFLWWESGDTMPELLIIYSTNQCCTGSRLWLILTAASDKACGTLTAPCKSEAELTHMQVSRKRPISLCFTISWFCPHSSL